MPTKEKICIIGLGYVGLPLLIELAEHYYLIGFDINKKRISELQGGVDKTNEISSSKLSRTIKLNKTLFTSNIFDTVSCSVYIVTVPTPIDKFKTPDFEPLKTASELVGGVLERQNLVIYESTVYPGATEEICIPILEKTSNLNWKKDFNVGYSPERINPGDSINKLPDITKIISADTSVSLQRVRKVYGKIIKAGLFSAESIMVAEAAKVIENVQRDVNIALINEIAVICSKLGIRTKKVLEAAATKWNFIPFTPGLVGGHCIGVDPYYLAHKAHAIGYYPELILSGRRINERMARHICSIIVNELAIRDKLINGSRIAILGVTFKEDCADVRNSKVFQLKSELERYKIKVDLFDPYAELIKNDIECACFELSMLGSSSPFDCVIIASPHSQIMKIGKEAIMKNLNQNGFLFDVKSKFPSCANTISL